MNKIRNDVKYSIKALMYLYENKSSKTIKAEEIALVEDILFKSKNKWLLFIHTY